MCFGMLSVNGLSVLGAAATLTFTNVNVGDSGRNNQTISDYLKPWIRTSIKQASTAAVAADTGLVVTMHPSSASLATANSAVTASGTITTQNLVPAGAATANSAVEITLSGSNAMSAQVTGTYTGALSLQATIDGTTWVTLGGTPLLNVNTGGYLASITSALQSVFQCEVGAFQKARITGLAAMSGTATVTLRATSGASAMVALDNALPAGANAIGSVTVSGTATNTPVTPTTTFTNSAATTNALSVKSSAGTLWSVVASNVSASTRYVKFFNLAVAPTVGTSVPVFTIPLAAGATVQIDGGSNGLRFATGIALCIVGGAGDADATAVAAADVKVATSFT
jgi:hypothetical protein